YNLMLSKNIHNFSELNERINVLKEQAQTANRSIVSIEHQLRELSEIIKYAEQYQENKPFNDRYENAKDQDRFLRKYESQIILFAGAERMLQRKGIDPRHMKLEHLRKQYRDLISQKEKLAMQHKSASADLKELEQIRQNLEEYLQVHPLDQEKPFNPNTTPEL
ncbi:MAG: hypothetical protein PUF40_14300, partial [Blautia massiliensis]|nr:hypothetical protein [Blautia massiliensis (ex Durand et al. 2017)]